jgi:hypothetical protein
MKKNELQKRTYKCIGLMGGNVGEIIEIDANESRLLNLVDSCEDVEVFKHGSRMYFGNKIQACKNYIQNNPTPADFSVWLQNNYKQL